MKPLATISSLEIFLYWSRLEISPEGQTVIGAGSLHTGDIAAVHISGDTRTHASISTSQDVFLNNERLLGNLVGIKRKAPDVLDVAGY